MEGGHLTKPQPRAKVVEKTLHDTTRSRTSRPTVNKIALKATTVITGTGNDLLLMRRSRPLA